MPRNRHINAVTALAVCALGLRAQDAVSLEQAASRNPADFSALYEGRSVAVRAQIASTPVWAVGTYYLPLRDDTNHGLILTGELERFAGFEPGDWIEVRGKISARAGLPLLEPDSIEKIRHTPPPAPKSLTVAEAAGLRYLGLMVEVTGTAANVGDNAGGTIAQISSGSAMVRVFLPRSPGASNDIAARIHAGGRVRAAGLLTQYAPQPPFNSDFQIMLPSAADLKVSGSGSFTTFWIAGGALLAIALLAFAAWRIRTGRVAAGQQATRTFHTLCEEIIAAPSPEDIAEKLMTVLPTITQATGAWLYIFNRRTKSLHRVPTAADPEPVAVPLDSPDDDALLSPAAVSFNNRAPVNIPDLHRSKYLGTRTTQTPPRSAMVVPLTTQGGVLGVLEAGNAARLGFFPVDEQSSIQHLANQVAAALKLQEQRVVREQLFRSEKLAATGQLISGVANELRAPLEVILHVSLQLATQLSTHASAPASETELRVLSAEARRASEIVSRLVSFARPEDSSTQAFDVNALLVSLEKFREPEWKALGLRPRNRFSPEPAFVLGAQGQIEQVFLNLLVHAEQCAAESPSKTVAIATSVLAGRVSVEIGYAARAEDAARDPFGEGRPEGGVSLDVCRTIVNNHGGSLRFGSRAGLALFEVEFPLVKTEPAAAPEHARRAVRALTLMLVDPEAGPQRQLLGMLSTRGHRVVPASIEEAADLAQRLRFDGVFWTMRASGAGSKWSEFQERTRPTVGAYVLVSDGYDAALAQSIEEGGNFLLGRPVQESDLDRILHRIATRALTPARR
jgi:signal transduction histidine kinase